MGWHPRGVRARLRGTRPYHRPCGHRMIETTAAPFPTIRVRPWLGRLAVATSLIATFMALVWAPTDAVQGDAGRGDRRHRGHRHPDRASVGAVDELAAPAADRAARRRKPVARRGDGHDARDQRDRLHARVLRVPRRTHLDRARPPAPHARGAGVIENLGFIVAAYVLVWGGIALYLISLR